MYAIEAAVVVGGWIRTHACDHTGLWRAIRGGMDGDVMFDGKEQT